MKFKSLIFIVIIVFVIAAREAHAGTITAVPHGQVAAINPPDLQCEP